MNPDAGTLAAGGPVDLDLSKVAPGQQVVVRWRSRPVFVINRPAKAARRAQVAGLAGSARRPAIAAEPAAALRQELASLGEARIRCAGRHLHPSRLHPDVLSAAERKPARGRLAGRLFLSLPRLEIRPWPGVFSAAFRRPTTCRYRPIVSSATRKFALVKIRPARASILPRSGRFRWLLPSCRGGINSPLVGQRIDTILGYE